MLSIITPVLNGSEFIENNIQSIQQLIIPHEHIIVDGGSTDGTLDVLKKYPHLIIVNQTKKLGMYHAIDLGFSIANGDILSWINSDDSIIKDGFEKMYNTFRKSKSDVVYSDGYDVNRTGSRIVKVKGRKYAKLLLKNGIFPFMQPASMFTKNIYNTVGGFDFDNFKIAGDLDLYYKFANVNNVIFRKVNVLSAEFLKYGDSLGDRNTNLANLERDRANIPRPNFIIKIFNKVLSLI